MSPLWPADACWPAMFAEPMEGSTDFVEQELSMITAHGSANVETNRFL